MKIIVGKEKEYEYDKQQWALWGIVSIKSCCARMSMAWDIGFAGFGLIASDGKVSVEADAPWDEVAKDYLYLVWGDWANDGGGYVDDMSEEWPLRFCPWCGEAVEVQEVSAAEHKDHGTN